MTIVGLLQTIGNTQPWMTKAICPQVDPDMFFLGPGEYSGHVKAICRACPVRQNCLEYGLNEPYGIWGGLGPRERHTLKRTQRGSPTPGVCVNGHDITAVGLCPSGGCKQCHQERHARYNARRKLGLVGKRKPA